MLLRNSVLGSVSEVLINLIGDLWNLWNLYPDQSGRRKRGGWREIYGACGLRVAVQEGLPCGEPCGLSTIEEGPASGCQK